MGVSGVPEGAGGSRAIAPVRVAHPHEGRVCACVSRIWAWIKALFAAIGRCFYAVIIGPFVCKDGYEEVQRSCTEAPVAIADPKGEYSPATIALLQILANVKGAEELMKSAFGTLHYAMRTIPGLADAVKRERNLGELEYFGSQRIEGTLFHALQEGIPFERAVKEIESLTKLAHAEGALQDHISRTRMSYRELEQFLTAYHLARSDNRREVRPDLVLFLERFLGVEKGGAPDLTELFTRVASQITVPPESAGMIEERRLYWAQLQRPVRSLFVESRVKQLEKKLKKYQAEQAGKKGDKERESALFASLRRPEEAIASQQRGAAIEAIGGEGKNFERIFPISFLSLPMGASERVSVDILLKRYFEPKREGVDRWLQEKNQWVNYQLTEQSRRFKKMPGSLFLGLERFVHDSLKVSTAFRTAAVDVPLQLSLPGVELFHELDAAITFRPKKGEGVTTRGEYAVYLKKQDAYMPQPVWVECNGPRIRVVAPSELRALLQDSLILHYRHES